MIDVSFISLDEGAAGCAGVRRRRALTAWRWSSRSSRSDATRIGKGGVVREAALRREALVAVGSFAFGTWRFGCGYARSGLPGPKGNRETFLWLPSPARRTG